MSDYRDPRVGLRQKIEELEDRLGKLTEAQTRIEAPWKLGPEWAHFSRTMFRIGRFVGRLLRRLRTNASTEAGILRARIAWLEERIILAESTVLRYRWPGKTGAFDEDASSHGPSENPEMDSAASESTADDAPGRDESSTTWRPRPRSR